MRAALTQTRDAYGKLPPLDQLHTVTPAVLEEVRAANVAHHADLARKAAAEGARVICFGELFTAPYFALGTYPVFRGLAEDARSGPTVQTLQSVACELAMVVIAPIYERSKTGDRYNTAVVIDADGELLGSYRKTHIPNGANEQGPFTEGYYYGPSDGEMLQSEANVSTNPFFPVFKTAFGRLGVMICYDRHFQGCCSALAHAGAQIVFNPAVTFGAKSHRMWHLEYPVDACRHRVFIGGSNRLGAEPPWTQEYFGESYFCGPDGVLENVSTHPELIVAELDLEALAGPDPAGWNLPRDTRPEIYSPQTPERVIDGARFSDLDGFYDEVSRVLVPDVAWGRNLDAFHDILRGGFGTPDSFVLVWRNADRSRALLGETFDRLVEIIRLHGPGGPDAEDGVELRLA